MNCVEECEHSSATIISINSESEVGNCLSNLIIRLHVSFCIHEIEIRVSAHAKCALGLTSPILISGGISVDLFVLFGDYTLEIVPLVFSNLRVPCYVITIDDQEGRSRLNNVLVMNFGHIVLIDLVEKSANGLPLNLLPLITPVAGNVA